MANEITALRERAKELGINTFQMGKDAIAEAIEAAENGAAPAGEDAPVDYDPNIENDDEPDGEDDMSMTGEDFPEDTEETEAEQESAPAAAPIDPAMVAVLAAQKAVEKAMAQLAQVQPKGKTAPSDSEIDAKLARDRAAIERDKKVPFGLEYGGGIGEPSYYTPCVNGKVYGIVVGAGKKPIPLAVAEVMERSIKQKRKNMDNMRKMSRAAVEQGIQGI